MKVLVLPVQQELDTVALGPLLVHHFGQVLGGLPVFVALQVFHIALKVVSVLDTAMKLAALP